MKSAFIVGYTGEIGKEVVKEAVAINAFSSFVLIGRRKVEFKDDDLAKLEQRIVDFDNLDEYAVSLKGFNIGLCCLGTTKGKAGAEGFYKVDHDYVVKVAELAKKGGCDEFHLVSSQSANKDSLFYYQRTKAETEEDIKRMNFKRFVVYRPGFLLCDRQESRPVETAFKNILKPITWAFPTFISIPTAKVAKVMVSKAVESNQEAKSIEILDNKKLHSLAK